MPMNTVDDWYTAGEAAKKISENSNRTVKPEYLRTLARLGKVTTKKIGERVTLYLKAEVDAYVVENRGEKVARIQKARSAKAKKEDKSAAWPQRRCESAANHTSHHRKEQSNQLEYNI